MPDSRLPEPLPQSIPDLERILLQQPPEAVALGLPDDLAFPRYGLSVANLPATFAALLGGELLPGAQPPLPRDLWADLADGVQRVIWITLDALGWWILREFLGFEGLFFSRLAEAGRLVPISSVFPTATTSALLTLWTGYSPAQHGMVGHTMYLRELGVLADMLTLSPTGSHSRDQLLERGLTLEEFLPVPGLAEVLAGQGIVTRALMNAELAKTGFSRLSFRGVAEVERFVTATGMCVALRHLLAAHRHDRLLISAYLAEIDVIGHLHGAATDFWRAELRTLSRALEHEFLRKLGPAERKGTLFILTSDHGQLVGPARPVPLADHPPLAERLLLPATGSLRAAYLYARQGELEAARHYLQEHLAQQFATVPSQAALQAGLLGPGQPAPGTASRLGDLILLGRDNYLLDYRRRTRPMLGMHAGISAEEMVVPLLLARLD